MQQRNLFSSDRVHLRSTTIKESGTSRQCSSEICSARIEEMDLYILLVLRDKADNIVKRLDRFRQVGDVTSNADPVHIGLP